MTRLNTTLLIGAACLMLACASGPEPTHEESVHQSMDELRAAALTTMKVPARAKEMVVLVDRLEWQCDEMLKAIRAHLQRLWALDADYDASEADFRKLFAEFNARRARRHSDVQDLAGRMAATTKDAAWSELAEARMRALETMVKAR